jgi:hypothetical protein
MNLYYQIDHLNKDCKIKKRYKKRKSKSFVKAFLSLLYIKVSTLGNTLPDYLNASQSEITSWSTFLLQGLNGETQIRCPYGYSGGQYQFTVVKSHLLGIVVGTGTNAVTSSDYALQTKIAQGTGSGQLEYSANGCGAVSAVNPTATMTLERIFRNASGGSITINEIGIYSLCHQNIYCLARDMISAAPVTMADGDYIKIIYTFTITV